MVAIGCAVERVSAGGDEKVCVIECGCWCECE